MTASLLPLVSAGALQLAALFLPAAPAARPEPAPTFTRADVRGRSGALVPRSLAFGGYRVERVTRSWRLAPQDRDRFYLPEGTREGFVFRLDDGSDEVAVRCGTHERGRREVVGCWLGTGPAARHIEAVSWRDGLLRGALTHGPRPLVFGGIPAGIRSPVPETPATYFVMRGADVVAAVSLDGAGTVWTSTDLDAGTRHSVAALAAVLYLHADLHG